jgi:hypothetical protein
MGIYRKRIFVRIHQHNSDIGIRSFGLLGDCDSQLMVLIALAHGIIQIESPLGRSNRRSPKILSQCRIGSGERFAHRFPAIEII